MIKIRTAKERIKLFDSKPCKSVFNVCFDNWKTSSDLSLEIYQSYNPIPLIYGNIDKLLGAGYLEAKTISITRARIRNVESYRSTFKPFFDYMKVKKISLNTYEKKKLEKLFQIISANEDRDKVEELRRVTEEKFQGRISDSLSLIKKFYTREKIIKESDSFIESMRSILYKSLIHTLINFTRLPVKKNEDKEFSLLWLGCGLFLDKTILNKILCFLFSDKLSRNQILSLQPYMFNEIKESHLYDTIKCFLIKEKD